MHLASARRVAPLRHAGHGRWRDGPLMTAGPRLSGGVGGEIAAGKGGNGAHGLYRFRVADVRVARRLTEGLCVLVAFIAAPLRAALVPDRGRSLGWGPDRRWV